ncbi:MAG: queuosine precursor transporter [Candidatus Hinthialibacter antarcticus]|nr:queuosine precursor transporter [Candidatus Hinthialibacter antarcticus]
MSIFSAWKAPTPLALQERVFIACAGIFIASLVSCNLIFQKFFTWSPFGWYTFEISVGLIPYPITFLVTDIVSEIYGRKRADQIVISGLLASIFVMGLILIAQAVPQTDWSPVSNEEFSKVFGLFGPAVFASMCAYLAAQFIDIRLFHFWKRLTKGRHLWLRNNASTIVSQLVDTIMVISLLCIFETIEWSRWYGLVENGFVYKITFALLDTPLFYLANWKLRKWMNLGKYDEIPEQQSLA